MSPSPRLLLVDDDVALTTILTDALEEDGFAVATAADGKKGLTTFRDAGPFDLVLLDVMMPELDGLSVCRKLRATSEVPVIFLTSRADDVDRITGLELGADDFVAKPFNTRELIARIRAVLRRARPAATGPATLTIAELGIDEARFLATWKGHALTLTNAEFKVLLALAKKPGFVLSRDQLIDHARGVDVVITERTIDTFIKRIRQKCTAVDPRFDAIETVIGVGYRLKDRA